MLPWQQWIIQKDQKHRPALKDFSTGGVFSWIELGERINGTCQFLKMHFPKDYLPVIGICGKNNLNLLLCYLAVLQLGGRVLIINPAFPKEKIDAIIQQAQLDFCLFLDPHGHFQQIQQNTPKRHRTLKSDLTQRLTMTLTSGSTGKPKVIVHNIEAHLANAKGVCELMNFTQENSWLLSLPLYHVSGQGIVWRWLQQGATLHLAGEDFYENALQSTHLSLVPTQLQRLLDYLPETAKNNTALSHILLGGSHIPVELIEQAQQRGFQCYSGYGMTEMASTVCAKKSDSTQSVGKPLKGREVQIINDEICLKGAGLAQGFWQNGEIMPVTNNGWLHTKDKGEWRQGELYILGRLDNQFISGGENIQPEEIENILLQNPLVTQCFVLPKADQEFGFRPVAFIQLKPQILPSEFQTAVLDLRVWLSDKIEKFKQPVHYYPLNLEKFQQQGNIKISRHLLIQELQNYDENN